MEYTAAKPTEIQLSPQHLMYGLKNHFNQIGSISYGYKITFPLDINFRRKKV